jgi:CBS domain-containing protein
MQVGDVMHRNVVTIDASESCQEAVAQMYRARIRHLPVLGTEGTLVGIVTDRDIRHYLFTPEVFRELGNLSVETLLKAVPVSEIMSDLVVTVDPEDDLEVAATLMLEDKIGSLPVTDRGRVVGILTETDLLRHIVRADARSGPDVEEIVVSFP